MRYQFKGTKWFLFWIVLLGFCSLIAYSQMIQSYSDKILEYENDQKYFNVNESYAFDEEVVLKIEKIIPLEIELHNSRFYLVEVNGENLFLKAEKNDEYLNEVIDGKRNALVVNYILEIERQSRGKRYQHLNDDLRNDLYNEALRNKTFIDKNEINYYFSLDYKNTQMGVLFSFIVLIIIEIILIWAVIYRIVHNRKALNYILSLGQERVMNFSDIINQSRYHNEILKLIIYQNELISYRNKIKTISLNQVEHVAFIMNVTYGYRGRKQVMYALIFTLADKVEKLEIPNHKKFIDEGNVFLDDLKRIYPNIKIDKL